MSIGPHQLASILQRAANMRPDVKKAVIKPEEGKDDLLMVDVRYYSPGRRVQRLASIKKIVSGDPPRNIGQILIDWLGSMPPIPKDQTNATIRERATIFSSTPEQVLGMSQVNRQTPPAKGASKFDWSKAKPHSEEHVTEGTLPRPIPDPSERRSKDHSGNDGNGRRRGPDGRFSPKSGL